MDVKGAINDCAYVTPLTFKPFDALYCCTVQYCQPYPININNKTFILAF